MEEEVKTVTPETPEVPSEPEVSVEVTGEEKKEEEVVVPQDVV